MINDCFIFLKLSFILLQFLNFLIYFANLYFKNTIFYYLNHYYETLKIRIRNFNNLLMSLLLIFQRIIRAIFFHYFNFISVIITQDVISFLIQILQNYYYYFINLLNYLYYYYLKYFKADNYLNYYIHHFIYYYLYYYLAMFNFNTNITKHQKQIMQLHASFLLF